MVKLVIEFSEARDQHPDHVDEVVLNLQLIFLFDDAIELTL
jgi:hypothetical protein